MTIMAGNQTMTNLALLSAVVVDMWAAGLFMSYVAYSGKRRRLADTNGNEDIEDELDGLDLSNPHVLFRVSFILCRHTLLNLLMTKP